MNYDKLRNDTNVEFNQYNQEEIINPVHESLASKNMLEVVPHLHEEKFIQRNNYVGPYSVPIIDILKLGTFKLPMEKCVYLANLSFSITKSVDDFWSKSNFDYDPSILEISADDIMPIFIYIIISAQYPELIYQLNFINEFVTTVTKSSMKGYYCTTIEGALSFIRSSKSRANLLSKLNEEEN